MGDYQRLMSASRKVVGTKQSLRAVQKGEARVVYLAGDAEPRVVAPLYRLCEEKGIEVVAITSMEELGRACRIEVGAAAAAILEE